MDSKSVNIHELIRVVQAGGSFEDGKLDFLVNDHPDLHDRPDTLYLSDGRTNDVSVVEQGTYDVNPTAEHLQSQLTTAMPAGWVYLRVPLAGDGRYALRRVVRSDGVEIAFGTNVWTTDRSFVGMGRRPVLENILHLLDYNSTGAYTLYFDAPPVPDTTAPSSRVAALPAASRTRIAVAWTGTDDRGVAFYDIYVSENGGSFLPWLQRTTLGSAVYAGAMGSRYAFYSVATDAAGNRQTAPGTPDAETVVSLVNHAPVMDSVAPQMINEGDTFAFRVLASDPDGDGLSFSLLGTAPASLQLDAVSGVISWPTWEATGPSTNTITVKVEDDGAPRLSATNTVTVIVTEVNTAPVLAAVTNYRIKERELLVVTNVATDADIPANTLRYSLVGPLPPGARIDPNNGLFNWRPNELQGPSTNLFTVVVTDNGQPPLSATQQFQVFVRDTLPDMAVSLGATNVLAGETNAVALSLATSLNLTTLRFDLQMASSWLTNLALESTAPEMTSLLLQETPGEADHSQLTIGLDPARMGSPSRQLARLHFLALSNEHSAIVPLSIAQLSGMVEGGAQLTNGTAQGGTVIVVGQEPVLVANRGANPSLTLYGIPGRNYALEYRVSLMPEASWSQERTVQMADRFVVLQPGEIPGASLFYRAREASASGASLSLQPASVSVYTLMLHGQPGVSYTIQTTTNLNDPATWTDWLDLSLTNTLGTFDWTNRGDAQHFLRSKEK